MDGARLRDGSVIGMHIKSGSKLSHACTSLWPQWGGGDKSKVDLPQNPLQVDSALTYSDPFLCEYFAHIILTLLSKATAVRCHDGDSRS